MAASPHPIKGISSLHSHFNPQLARKAKKKAPPRPSQVFFGLMCGIIL